MGFVSFVVVVVAAVEFPAVAEEREQLSKTEEVQQIHDKGKCQSCRKHRYYHITA